MRILWNVRLPTGCEVGKFELKRSGKTIAGARDGGNATLKGRTLSP